MPRWWISSTWVPLPESDDDDDDNNNYDIINDINDEHNHDDHNNDEDNNDANIVAV